MVLINTSKIVALINHNFESKTLNYIFFFVLSSLIFCTIQFLILSTVSALIYPGGYDYFRNYFSELGRVIALNGENNPISSILFTLSMIIASVTLIPFWVGLPILFLSYLTSPLQRLLNGFASGFGLLSVPFQIAVALFPIDTQPILHGLAAQGFFILSSIAILVYSLTMYISHHYSNVLAITGFIIFFLVGLFVLGIFGDFQPFIQKLIIFSFIIWAIIQIYWSWYHSKSNKAVQV